MEDLPLTAHEQTLLWDLEKQLAADDVFVRRMRRSWPPKLPTLVFVLLACGALPLLAYVHVLVALVVAIGLAAWCGNRAPWRRYVIDWRAERG